MSMQSSKCEKCGQDVAIGEWPYCPHGHIRRFGHAPMEECYDEMISEDGMSFTTWGEKLKYMDKHAIEPRKQPKLPGHTLYFDQGRR